MKLTSLPQLSEILLTLKNINDNIRRCEDTAFEICKKLNTMEDEKNNVSKHIVVIRKEENKQKEKK